MFSCGEAHNLSSKQLGFVMGPKDWTLLWVGWVSRCREYWSDGCWKHAVWTATESMLNSSCKSLPFLRCEMVHRVKISLIITFHKLDFFFAALHIKAVAVLTEGSVIKFLLLPTHAHKLISFSDFLYLYKHHLLYSFLHLTLNRFNFRHNPSITWNLPFQSSSPRWTHSSGWIHFHKVPLL